MAEQGSGGAAGSYWYRMEAGEGPTISSISLARHTGQHPSVSSELQLLIGWPRECKLSMT